MVGRAIPACNRCPFPRPADGTPRSQNAGDLHVRQTRVTTDPRAPPINTQLRRRRRTPG